MSAVQHVKPDVFKRVAQVVRREVGLSRLVWGPDGLFRDANGCFVFLGEVDRATLRDSFATQDRNHCPALLFDLYYGEILDLERPDMAGVVADVWSSAEYPQQAMRAFIWRELFHANGFSHDGTACKRPSAPVTVYRGCHRNGRFRMSWSTDLAIARRFAYGRIGGRDVGDVYTATVPSECLLAFIDDEIGRGESEFVVDPIGLSADNVAIFDGGDVTLGSALVARGRSDVVKADGLADSQHRVGIGLRAMPTEKEEASLPASTAIPTAMPPKRPISQCQGNTHALADEHAASCDRANENDADSLETI